MRPETIRAFLKRIGLKPNRPDFKIYDWGLAMRMYQRGAPDGVIAIAIGCSTESVRKWRDEKELIPNASEEKRGRTANGKPEPV